MCKSKKQSIVALSSADAEYVSLATFVNDVTWIRKTFL